MKPPHDPAIERLTLNSMSARLLEQFHLDRGLGYTLKLLALRPRRAIEEYLFEDRRRMIRPFTLLLLSVAVATFLSLEFLLQENIAAEAEAELAHLPERIQRAFALSLAAIRNYFNLVYMSSLPPMTLATFLVFRSRRLNLAEHLVLNTYLFSVQTLLFILAIPVLVLRESQSMWTSVIPVAYTIWFYKDVFDLGWGAGLLRSALVFLLGQALWILLGALAFGVLLIVVG